MKKVRKKSTFAEWYVTVIPREIVKLAIKVARIVNRRFFSTEVTSVELNSFRLGVRSSTMERVYKVSLILVSLFYWVVYRSVRSRDFVTRRGENSATKRKRIVVVNSEKLWLKLNELKKFEWLFNLICCIEVLIYWQLYLIAYVYIRKSKPANSLCLVNGIVLNCVYWSRIKHRKKSNTPIVKHLTLFRRSNQQMASIIDTPTLHIPQFPTWIIFKRCIYNIYVSKNCTTLRGTDRNPRSFLKPKLLISIIF